MSEHDEGSADSGSPAPPPLPLPAAPAPPDFVTVTAPGVIPEHPEPEEPAAPPAPTEAEPAAPEPAVPEPAVPEPAVPEPAESWTPPAGPSETVGRTVGPLAVATAVCVVLAIAAGALLAVTARSSSHHRAVAEARTAALAAARRETALALTYNFQTLDQDFARAEQGMSRSFRANYAHTAATEVAPLAQQTHAITTGTIVAAGVVSATPSRAKILVFADQTVENRRLNATSRLDRSVIEVSMLKQNGRWVIDYLQPF